MTLLRRLSRLLKADMHGILDNLEEPEEVLKQSIRDMEAALACKSHTLAVLQSRLQRLRAEVQAAERAVRDIDHQIDICFEAANHTLARNFIRKRLVVQRQVRKLSGAIEELHPQQAALEHIIAEQRQQLAAVVQQFEHYASAHQAEANPTTPFAPAQGDASVTDDEVEVAFLDEQRRRAGRTQTTTET